MVPFPPEIREQLQRDILFELRRLSRTAWKDLASRPAYEPYRDQSAMEALAKRLVDRLQEANWRIVRGPPLQGHSIKSGQPR